MDWYYLSFANDGWLGACIVQGETVRDAIKEAHRRKINPGGQVLMANLSAIDAIPPERFRNKLLSKDDLQDMDSAMGGEGELGSVKA